MLHWFLRCMLIVIEPSRRLNRIVQTKTKSAKPALAALLAAKKQRVAKHPASLANAALNGQSRRVLAQHYRAKYGVK